MCVAGWYAGGHQKRRRTAQPIHYNRITEAVMSVPTIGSRHRLAPADRGPPRAWSRRPTRAVRRRPIGGREGELWQMALEFAG